MVLAWPGRRGTEGGNYGPPRHTIGAVSAGVVTVPSSTIFIPEQDEQKEGDPEVQKDAKDRVPWCNDIPSEQM